MTDVEIRESEELVLPNGTVVSLEDPRSCALALDDLRELRRHINEATSLLQFALIAESKRRGEKTFEVDDGLKAEVRAGRVHYDAQALEEGLRALGCPEERIGEIIFHEVTPRVRATEANRAARANDDYARLIESCRKESPPTVSVSRRSTAVSGEV